jgi:hypothetical protein
MEKTWTRLAMLPVILADLESGDTRTNSGPLHDGRRARGGNPPSARLPGERSFAVPFPANAGMGLH